MIEHNNGLITPEWTLKNTSSSVRLIAGFTTSLLGNQSLARKSLSLKATTRDNRENLCSLLNIPIEFIFSLHQIHSDIIIEVNQGNRGQGATNFSTALEGDASITKEKNILLFTTYADCVPILLYDPVTQWIGAIHSGWKGVSLNIVKKSLNLLRSKNVNSQNLFVAIGPAIRGCCYEVQEDFKNNFGKSILANFFYFRDNKIFFDLASAVHWQLLNENIPPDNIDFYGKCTCCNDNPRFFSYRRDKENYETQAGFIGKIL